MRRVLRRTLSGRRSVGRSVGSVLVLVTLGACLGAPQPDPSRFFLLSPVSTEAPEGRVPVSVGVGPVTLPGYLDRPQLVTRLGENQIALSETDRWAEPFADNVSRALRESLAALLPGSTHVPYPWYAADAPDYAVGLFVRRFEADTTGVVALDATWTLVRDGEQIDGRAFRLQEPAEEPGRPASVAAQSRALEALGREVAAAVRAAAGR